MVAMRSLPTATSVLLTLAFATGCGDDGGATVCTPGKADVCPCPGGEFGSQMCKDDGSGYEACMCPGDTTGPTTGITTTASATAGSTSDGTTSSGSSTGGTSTTGAGSSTGGASTGMASTTGAATTGGGTVKWLQNDGFMDGAAVGVQQGFVQGECWASVYVPDPGDYPFQVTGVQAIIGGSMETATFNLRVYEVDGQNTPTNILDETDIQVMGSDQAFNEADFDTVMLQKPVITSGNFAIAMCFTTHSGVPAIARDTDGTITADRNWIFAQGLGWVQSQTLGLQGDWIMRARIEPM
ncbi:MAG: hypothetical protein D6705_03420 [Deltaproteobacteria bacterium]|nr:MAG: hypothetical protein D6705_03420 [Deltaproteobacteria bacterium]